ncbi:hypothetical protein DFH29DRAFT_882217 [Suillus ampliporus]|nr:hypothetical protein DFH29DRAFT_882217 [Suillus ampliporus]
MPVMKMTVKKSNGGSALCVVITLPAGNVSDTSQNEEIEVVSNSSSHNNQKNRPTCFVYFGFHYSNRWLVLDRFLNICGILELSLYAEIYSAPIFFIYLKIVDYDAMGGLFKLIYHFLKPYFLCGRIEYHEMAFDIAATAKANSYQQGVDITICALKEQGKWDHVVIDISDHTDNDKSNTFIGYEGKKNTLLYLLIIALVNNIKSFKNLQTSILHHHLSAAVAFTIPYF